MRLCLFLLEEDNLIGFYDDLVVYPIDQAAQAYYEATGFELGLPDVTDPLELLPPNGVFREVAKLLWEWIQSLEPEA